MAVTLSFGFRKPQAGDKGNIFWPILEDVVEQLNDHTHNGVNSSKLTSLSSLAVVQNILAAAWADLTEGNFRQLVTVPSGFAVDTCTISLREATSGDYLNLRIEKETATTFYVYINDNSLSLKAVYTS